VAQIGPEGLGDAGCELSVLLLWGRWWNLLGPLSGTFTFAPEDPLERNVCNAKLFRFGDDQAGHVGGEFLPMRPFLYGCFSYATAERRSKLSVAQRDTFPRAEDI
jgi:hypothetical protein